MPPCEVKPQFLSICTFPLDLQDEGGRISSLIDHEIGLLNPSATPPKAQPTPAKFERSPRMTFKLPRCIMKCAYDDAPTMTQRRWIAEYY